MNSQEAAAPNAPALFSRCDACSMALSGKAACLCAAAVHWPYPNPLLGDCVRLLTATCLPERSNSYFKFMSSL